MKNLTKTYQRQSPYLLDLSVLIYEFKRGYFDELLEINRSKTRNL